MNNLMCTSKTSNCSKQKKSLLEVISRFRLYILISVSISMVEIYSSVNYLAVLLMSGICLFAFFDIVINDILPDRFYIKILYNNRHIVYMFISLLIFCISAEYIHTIGYTYSLIRLWLDGCMVAVIAVSDIFIRYMHTDTHNILEPEC